MTCRGKAADHGFQIDGAESTRNDLAALHGRFLFSGAVRLGRLLSRARIQHFRLFFPRVDLLLRRWSAANGGRTRSDRSHRYRRTPRCTSAFVPEHVDLLHVHFVGPVL